MAQNAVQIYKTVADPIAEYESMMPIWRRNKAVCGGERLVKEFDAKVDVVNFTNMLLPFSPTMSQDQYRFYRAEGELPGIVSQFSKMLVGGLLRKRPSLTLPDSVPEEARNWILNEFSEDGGSLVSFLDAALEEEVPTSHAWIYVDYPEVPDTNALPQELLDELKPYPVLWKAADVINWTTVKDPVSGKKQLSRVILRKLEESFGENEFHPTLKETVYVHEVVSGYYQVRVYQEAAGASNVPVANGERISQNGKVTPHLELIDTITNFVVNDERLKFIPAWPLNGTIDCTEPIITPIVDKEIALYNKMSRRNHLLYGAATYTPVIIADMTDDEFDEIVKAGLGSWLRLPANSTATILDTPTAALADMEAAIAAAIEEMARLGIRMLSPEAAQSGVALELRNAAQTAQLGTLNAKVSSTMSAIICFMLNWRYDLNLTIADVNFQMSEDFNPAPVGADWLRLISEWYEGGLIPRSVWLQILKQNDIVPPEYDDKKGQAEINQDETIVTPKEQASLNMDLQQQQLISQQQAAKQTAGQSPRGK